MSTCYRPGGMHYPHNGEFNLDYEDEWNTLSIYEKLCYIKAKLDENNTTVQEVVDQLALKEDSDNITLVRLLSEAGDFTGTLAGETVSLVLANIQSNTNQIDFLTNQFEDGATGLVVDGGAFDDTDIDKLYDGGVW